jgi:hypothetical protein
VFVVWEPILSTDWSPPSTFAMHLIPDTRARQYWDPDHIVAKKLAADRRPPQPEEECCEQSGILWDLVAVYPRGATWSDRLPVAVLFNGPVVDVKSELESSFVAPKSALRIDPPQLQSAARAFLSFRVQMAVSRSSGFPGLRSSFQIGRGELARRQNCRGARRLRTLSGVELKIAPVPEW